MPFIVTVISMVAGEPAGETHVMLVAEATTTLVAELVPNFTVAPEAKLVPVIVTEVPAVKGPLVGDTAVTVGAL